tara:strand:+ start:14327 stop:14674 length:348 start_codon:yes stop_codon:yes gene_type:complete
MQFVYDPYETPNVSDITVTHGTVRLLIPHEMFFSSISGFVELPPVITQGLANNNEYKKAFFSRQAALSHAYVNRLIGEEELLEGHDIIHGWQQWGTIPRVMALSVTDAPLGLTGT